MGASPREKYRNSQSGQSYADRPFRGESRRCRRHDAFLPLEVDMIRIIRSLLLGTLVIALGLGTMGCQGGTESGSNQKAKEEAMKKETEKMKEVQKSLEEKMKTQPPGQGEDEDKDKDKDKEKPKGGK